MNITLKIDGQNNPIAIRSLEPAFSFSVEDASGTAVQSFRISLFTDKDMTKLIADSGLLSGDVTMNVRFDAELEYATKYYVLLLVTLDNGDTGVQTATFETPLLTFDADWIMQPSGVDGEPVFRFAFDIPGEIQSARLYSTALGLYEAHVNGSRVGDGYLAPGYTDYRDEVHYDTYDVTDMLGSGKNAVAVLLGKGWYCGHVFQTNQFFGKKILYAARLSITLTSGKTLVFDTSDKWKCIEKSPFLCTDNNNGEDFDARRYFEFSDVSFDDSGWKNCVLANDDNAEKAGKLSETAILPRINGHVRIYDELHPIRKLFNQRLNCYYFDLGQNFAGTARFTLRGRRGDKITFRYGEMLNETGNETVLYTENLRTAKATDTYVKGSDEEEIYVPRFTFHGYRYIEVSGCPGITEKDVVGLPFATEMERTGYLETGNALVNRLYQNIVWGQLSNYISIPTDCPQRDERAGWTGDAEVFVGTGCYNFDCQTFFEKYSCDMTTAQKHTTTGFCPDYCPSTLPAKRARFSAAWGDAAVIIPAAINALYGNTKIVEESYEAMKSWVANLVANSVGGILHYRHSYGDWLSVAPSPRCVTDTAFFAHSVDLLAALAKKTGKEKDAKYYGALFAKIKSAYNKRFVTSDFNVYGSSQTVYTLTLAFDLVDDEEGRKTIAKRLVADIQKRGNLISTGFIGVSKVCLMLSRYGYDDIAYNLLLQEKYPSWLYSVKNGATTIWERWNSWTKESGFGDVRMNSFNHYSLGSIGEWMYRYMLGISSDDGYKTILLSPRPDARLGYVKGSYKSPYDKISAEWSLSEHTLSYAVTIPCNTEAVLTLPVRNATVNGQSPESACEVEKNSGGFVARLKSGTYKVVGEFIPTVTENLSYLCTTTDSYSERCAYTSDVVRRCMQLPIKLKSVFSKTRISKRK